MTWHLSTPDPDSASWRLDLRYTSENLELLRKTFFGTSFPTNPVEGQLWTKEVGSAGWIVYIYRDNEWHRLIGSPLELPGGIEYNTREITADDILEDSDDTVFVDAETSAVTLGLPTDINAGQTFYVIKTDSSANLVTLSTDENINGIPEEELSAQYDYIKITYDGTTWYKIGSSS